MARGRSRRSSGRAFVAYQRGDLLGAPLHFEEASLLYPAHEEGLLNHARTPRALGAGAAEKAIGLAGRAIRVPTGGGG